ncbi:15497_t:CDS:2, partial [Funneliformis geosporum]
MRENELFEAQCERIIGAYLSGIKQTVISTQLSIPTSTVNDTIKRYKETGSAIPEKRPVRSLSDITSRLNSSLDTTLHNNTVRKYLHDEGLGSYVTRKKPLLTQKQQKDRFALFESDGRIRAWRSPGEAYNKNCILPT